MHTMLNRAKQTGQSLGDVVTAPNQYEGASVGAKFSDDDPEVQDILHNIVVPSLSGDLPDPTGGKTHYYNPDLQAMEHEKNPERYKLHPSFAQGDGQRIGNHVFYEHTGGRVGRASGGKVTPPRVHEMLVNRLMKLAKDAKTVSDKKTEPLLNAPDEHIVKALDVAQRAI